MGHNTDTDWPTTTRTVEKKEQEKKELEEGKPTPMTDAAIGKKNNNHKTKASVSKEPKTEFADDFVPYPDTGHDMEQLMSWGEDKQRAVLGKNWPDFKKRYLK
jgi:hypothetical protein